MEPNTQTYTNAPTATPVAAPGDVQTLDQPPLLSPQQENYVSYLAMGGLLPAEGGAGKKVTAEQFAISIGVARETLYYWRKHIPDLWERVADRRAELGGKDRLSQVWNGIFLKAAAGNPEAAKLYLANFDPNFRMPTEKHEVDAGGGFMDLLQRMRQENAQANKTQIIDAQEAVVVHDSNQSQPANITAGS